MGISYLTTRNSDNESFYLANRKSPWFVVAFGMIGATLSGVTFISVPGAVGAGGANMQFAYMQMVFGFLIGYWLIAGILLPLYYRLELTSIYTFLEKRFGTISYKMGAIFFLLSRIIGASLRLYLVAMVLHLFVLGPMGIGFLMTVLISILLIWSYTYIGGLKTIIWTDTLQTLFILLAVILTIVHICSSLKVGLTEIPQFIKEAGYGKMFFFEEGWKDPNNFYKQFISGILMAFVMTGLDQDMMQKNISCRTLKDAQKNMISFSIVLLFAKILFITLGALLFIYAGTFDVPIPDRSDQMYPTLAFQYFSPTITILFILGLVAAAYSSADSALTSLTTSFSIDILDLEKSGKSEEEKKKIRIWVHLGFSAVLFLVIAIFNMLNDDAVINNVFRLAGYTYGPLLGLFLFGIIHKVQIKDKWVWIVCLLAPILSYLINEFSPTLFNGLSFGFLILAVNGFLTYLGLWIISKRAV